jgi:peptidyl-prolyl cis-trans isomerase C
MNNAVRPLAAIAIVVAGLAPAFAQAPDPTLASNTSAKVTLADFEASILRIPEQDRFGWAMSQERINKEIESLLRIRSVANQAKKQGLDSDPKFKIRVALYAERLLAEALSAKIDAESQKEFESRRETYLARAREQYLVNKQQFMTPVEVKASHILVGLVGRTPDEALAKAKGLRERVVNGESFADLAVSNSDDASAKQNRGELGYFGANQMDPAFEAAAFAMKTPGEVSEPVRSRFGYHI